MVLQSYIVPLSPVPQSFTISLAGVSYQLTVKWSSAQESGWYLDIQQAGNAAPVLMGLPLVTGCDLLEPYGYLNFNGSLVLDSELPATTDSLGQVQQLVFVTRSAGNG